MRVCLFLVFALNIRCVLLLIGLLFTVLGNFVVV